MYKEIQADIQKNYTNFLENTGFKPRKSQKHMIAKIAQVLNSVEEDEQYNLTGKNALALIEAGTGTGKTLAYLLTGISFATHKNKKLVVATATIALQEQIVFKDLPTIIEKTNLKIKYALAKGRSRYLCIAKLQSLTAKNKDFLTSEFIPAYSVSEEKILTKLLGLYASGEWDGDKDKLEFNPSIVWQKLTADNKSCTKKKCPFFLKSCPYYKAREDIEKADVIVTNQNLVLTDLNLGGGILLPDLEDSILIIDEAHNFPAKALDAFASNFRIKSSIKIHKSLEQSLAKLEKLLAKEQHITKNFASYKNYMGASLTNLNNLLQVLEKFGTHSTDKKFIRLFRADITQEVIQACQHCINAFMQLQIYTDRIIEQLKDLDDQTYNVHLWLGEFESFIGNLDKGLQVFQNYISLESNQDLPIARWIDIYRQEDGIDLELSASPVLASAALDRHLWQKSYAVVLTSATLTTSDFQNAKSFAHFLEISGLPSWTQSCALPANFDYKRQVQLFVPQIAIEPNDSDRENSAIITLKYIEELLPNTCKSALVLFNSRAQMEKVVELLPAHLSDIVSTQDDSSKQDVLEKHKEKIDSGEKSIIFGLASFAEGIDLPGDYLQEVAIVHLPFSHPENPVKQTLKDWFLTQNRNYFSEEVLPDTGLKLIQACGRLIRKETDKGRIVILDRRIITKGYGKILLNALPPFSVYIE